MVRNGSRSAGDALAGSVPVPVRFPLTGVGCALRTRSGVGESGFSPSRTGNTGGVPESMVPSKPSFGSRTAVCRRMSPAAQGPAIPDADTVFWSHAPKHPVGRRSTRSDRHSRVAFMTDAGQCGGRESKVRAGSSRSYLSRPQPIRCIRDCPTLLSRQRWTPGATDWRGDHGAT